MDIYNFSREILSNSPHGLPPTCYKIRNCCHKIFKYVTHTVYNHDGSVYPVVIVIENCCLKKGMNAKKLSLAQPLYSLRLLARKSWFSQVRSTQVSHMRNRLNLKNNHCHYGIKISLQLILKCKLRQTINKNNYECLKINTFVICLLLSHCCVKGYFHNPEKEIIVIWKCQ